MAHSVDPYFFILKFVLYLRRARDYYGKKKYFYITSSRATGTVEKVSPTTESDCSRGLTAKEHGFGQKFAHLAKEMIDGTFLGVRSF